MTFKTVLTPYIDAPIHPDDQVSLFFVEHYGQKDKVTGRIFELPCPLCIGTLEKTQ